MNKLEKQWFKHDINASNDTKIQQLEFKLGLEGYAIFFKIVEVLMQNNGMINNDLEMLSFQLKTDKIESVRAVVNNFNLFVVENDMITNKRVLEGLKAITEKSNKAKESANKRWNNT